MNLHPFRGFGIPDDIARAALFLASEDASWISGVRQFKVLQMLEPWKLIIAGLSSCRRWLPSQVKLQKMVDGHVGKS